MDVLKRHNALCVKHVTDAQNNLKQQLVKENICFAESLVSMLGCKTILQLEKSSVGLPIIGAGNVYMLAAYARAVI